MKTEIYTLKVAGPQNYAWGEFVVDVGHIKGQIVAVGVNSNEAGVCIAIPTKVTGEPNKICLFVFSNDDWPNGEDLSGVTFNIHYTLGPGLPTDFLGNPLLQPYIPWVERLGVLDTTVQTWKPCGGIAPTGIHMNASNSGLYYAPGPTSFMHFSHDGGATWFTAVAAGSHDWSGSGISADGQIIVCSYSQSLNGRIRRSGDGGLTWIDAATPPIVPFGDFWDCSMSDDGQHVLVCGASGQQLLISHDYGLNFTYVADPKDYKGCDVSADGKYMIAVAGQMGTYYPSFSSDYGATWSNLLPAGARDYLSCAISDDGLTILAVSISMGAVLSKDGGATFNPVLDLLYRQTASMTGDGMHLLTSPPYDGANPYKPTESLDGGLTWQDADTPDGDLPGSYGSGSAWIARGGSHAIYTLHEMSGPPWMRLFTKEY